MRDLARSQQAALKQVRAEETETNVSISATMTTAGIVRSGPSRGGTRREHQPSARAQKDGQCGGRARGRQIRQECGPLRDAARDVVVGVCSSLTSIAKHKLPEWLENRRAQLAALIDHGIKTLEHAAPFSRAERRAVFDVLPSDQVRQLAEIAGAVVEAHWQDSGTDDPAALLWRRC